MSKQMKKANHIQSLSCLQLEYPLSTTEAITNLFSKFKAGEAIDWCRRGLSTGLLLAFHHVSAEKRFPQKPGRNHAKQSEIEESFRDLEGSARSGQNRPADQHPSSARCYRHPSQPIVRRLTSRTVDLAGLWMEVALLKLSFLAMGIAKYVLHYSSTHSPSKPSG